MPSSLKNSPSARKSRSHWIALRRFVVRGVDAVYGVVMYLSMVSGIGMLLYATPPLIEALYYGVPLNSTHSFVPHGYTGVNSNGFLILRPYYGYVFWGLAGVLFLSFGLLLHWIVASDRYRKYRIRIWQ